MAKVSHRSVSEADWWLTLAIYTIPFTLTKEKFQGIIEDNYFNPCGGLVIYGVSS
jgi:hypothetical protein